MNIYLLKIFLILNFSFFTFNHHASNGVITQNANEHKVAFIEQDWNLAKQQAKEANKLIFVDVYATWCGPCKMLQQKTFTNAKVAEFLNTHFINLSIDAEKTIGPQVARYFGVTAYPTLVFTDASGKPVLYTMGYMGTKAFLKFANAALAKAQK